MNDPTITCPHCQAEIPLTESLAAPLVAATRRDFEAKLARKEAETTAREAALAARERELAAARGALDQEVTRQVDSQLAAAREALVAEEARKAKLSAAAELAARLREVTDLKALLEERDAKLAEAQLAQAETLRRQRELDDARRELELNIEKRVQQSLDEARAGARREAEDALKLQVAEKDQAIVSMKQTIEELKRKAEQGSQQLQGEVQELALEALLAARFPHDTIEPVAKGEFGGDALQRVVAPGGIAAGALLWESKRTRHWSDGWLAKLREDQRTAKADVAVLVSQALPRGVDTFDCIDGVWVTSPRSVLPVALVLRQSLIELALARKSAEGHETKTEMVYAYLTGPRFRQRVEAIVEAFSSMNEDLDRERKAIMKQWAKREAQISRVMTATVGMYGDLQGIAGRSLQEIEGLALPAPTDDLLLE